MTTLKEHRKTLEVTFSVGLQVCDHSLAGNCDKIVWENMKSLYKKGLEVIKKSPDDKFLDEIQEIISLMDEAKKLL